MHVRGQDRQEDRGTLSDTTKQVKLLGHMIKSPTVALGEHESRQTNGKQMVQMAKKPTWNFPKHLKDSQDVRNEVL